MKVLIVTQYFYPENFKSNDIAFTLAERGMEVDVLVGIPNYPEGKYYKGYGIFRKRIEKINGIRVYRVFQTPRGRNRGWKLALNYVTYTIFASIWAFLLSMLKTYDAIIVHQPSPITQGIPAVLIKKIKKTPIYFWVLDIWPESMTSGSGIKNKYVLSVVDKIVRAMYNHSKKILISSTGFEPFILAKGDYKHKIVYFPNWSEDLLKMADNYPIPALPEGFIIMLAGNLGSAQLLDAIMYTALELKEEKNLKWIFIGDGSYKEWLNGFVKEHSLQNTVFIYGKFPFEAMPTFYKKANAMLLTLRCDFPHLKATVPARLQSYMAASKPIIAMIEGESAKIIQEAKCGLSVAAGDNKAFTTMIKEKVLSDKTAFEDLGKNGRKYFEKFFQKDICISHLIEIITND